MKRLILTFALLGMTVLFMTGCGESASPKTVVEQFCKSNFAESKKYIVPSEIAAYEKACQTTYKEWMMDMDPNFPKSYFSGTIQEPKISGDTAEVEMDNGGMSFVFNLKKVNGDWYISRVPVISSAWK